MNVPILLQSRATAVTQQLQCPRFAACAVLVHPEPREAYRATKRARAARRRSLPDAFVCQRVSVRHLHHPRSPR